MCSKHKPKSISLQGEINMASPKALFWQLDNKTKR